MEKPEEFYVNYDCLSRAKTPSIRQFTQRRETSLLKDDDKYFGDGNEVYNKVQESVGENIEDVTAKHWDNTSRNIKSSAITIKETI